MPLSPGLMAGRGRGGLPCFFAITIFVVSAVFEGRRALSAFLSGRTRPTDGGWHW